MDELSKEESVPYLWKLKEAVREATGLVKKKTLAVIYFVYIYYLLSRLVLLNSNPFKMHLTSTVTPVKIGTAHCCKHKNWAVQEMKCICVPEN